MSNGRIGISKNFHFIPQSKCQVGCECFVVCLNQQIKIFSVNLEYPVDVSLEAKSKLDLMNHQLESYVDKLSYKHIRGPEISLIKDKLARNE